jgi:hypothetical protein
MGISILPKLDRETLVACRSRNALDIFHATVPLLVIASRIRALQAIGSKGEFYL